MKPPFKTREVITACLAALIKISNVDKFLKVKMRMQDGTCREEYFAAFAGETFFPFSTFGLKREKNRLGTPILLKNISTIYEVEINGKPLNWETVL